jgi:predicted aldo/keto reductase-like oxidoreductase
MKTDTIDIYLMHGIGSVEDVENRLLGGVFDALQKAKQEGKIGHIGFSGHADPAAHNYLIDKNLTGLEVVLLPVNVADPTWKSFILNTLPKARERNMGVIGMKIYAGGGFYGGKIVWGNDVGHERERVIPEIISKKEAQHFAYSLPVSATTIGCHDAGHVEENISITKSYTGLGDAEYKELIDRVSKTALGNTLEHYKAKD